MRVTLVMLRFTLIYLLIMFCSGCASSSLQSAREIFYLGRAEQATETLAYVSRDNNDHVLALMERGLMHQSMNNHVEATRDWLAAVDIAEELDYYSVSRGVASLIVNDRMLAYRGLPYERTLLRSFAAKSYFALHLWDDAAVEARNIIDRQEGLNGFPDDAYSRYMAGFCMEMIDNYEAAERQYKAANKLLPGLVIDTTTGRFKKAGAKKEPEENKSRYELVCFVGIGRAPRERGYSGTSRKWGWRPYAEIYAGEKYLGRSYQFATTKTMLAKTQSRLAAIQAAKDVTRIVVKEVIAAQVSEENKPLGELIRLILYALEAPDTRRWETLPAWLHIARVPYDGKNKELTVKYRNFNGVLIEEKKIEMPVTRREKKFVSFVRAL